MNNPNSLQWKHDMHRVLSAIRNIQTPLSILETGTKRSGKNSTSKKQAFSDLNVAEYIRTDISPCEHGDVDVECDLHAATQTFGVNRFDLIVCMSVFEHIKYPWVVALEYMKMLKPNGFVYIQTHQTFPLHAYPYDYYRFSVDALQSLFPIQMGMLTQFCEYSLKSQIIPPKEVKVWCNVAPNYLNVALFSKKVSPTPPQWIY